MNTQNGLLLWVLGGAGVLFLYAAYKNQNPQTILANHLQGTAVSNPISSYGNASVPTAVKDGKTYNTKPGNGPYITTEPPVPGGVSGGSNLGLYADANGNPVGVIPAVYQNNPNLFISAGRNV